MSDRWKQELRVGAHLVRRALVPDIDERALFAPAAVPALLVYLTPLIFLAYLARRPNTYAARLLLLPAVLLGILKATFSYRFDEYHAMHNWFMGLCGAHFVALALDYALCPDSKLKQDETVAGNSSTCAAAPGTPPSLPARLLPPPLADALELLCSMRGLGFNFGRGTFVPLYTRPLQRGPFLRATARSLLLNALTIDVQSSLLKLAPGVGSPSGGTIFLPQLPPPQRHALAMLLTVCTGSAVLACVQAGYDAATLVAVGLLRQSPRAWPPVMGDPWRVRSVGTLWGRAWHQLLRRTFVLCGGIPGGGIGGSLGSVSFGAVIGTFFASGMYHEVAIYSVGRGLDSRVLSFFLLQGLAVLSERMWKNVTGRRVGGVAGVIWTYAVVLGIGEMAADAWLQRGIGATEFFPPSYSPSQRLVIPILHRLWNP